MPKTIPSRQAVSKFENRLTKALHRHQEMMLATHNKVNQAALETMLVEQFVMASAVLWEAFISDLIITYVVMSPEVYIKTLKLRMEESLQSKFGSEAAKHVKFSLPKVVTRPKAIGLIDPQGFNVTASDAQKLSDRANLLLVAKHAKKFSLDADDSAFFNFLICIRNYLGHRSFGSREELKEALSNLKGLDNAPLTGKFKEIGPYLKSKTASGDTRAVIIIRRMLQIAQKLQ